MFFQSVISGLALLVNFEVWFGALLASAVVLAGQAILTRNAGTNGDEKPAARGCVSVIIGGVLLPSIVLVLYLTWIMPFLLGGTAALPLNVVISLTGRMLTAAIVGLLVVGLMALAASSFPPFALIGHSETFRSFIGGVVICRIMVGGAIEAHAQELGRQAYFPGLFQSAGFVVLAAAISFLMRAISTWAASQRKVVDMTAPAKDLMSVLLILPLQALGTIVGLLPVFMYMRYAVLSFSP